MGMLGFFGSLINVSIDIMLIACVAKVTGEVYEYFQPGETGCMLLGMFFIVAFMKLVQQIVVDIKCFS